MRRALSEKGGAALFKKISLILTPSETPVYDPRYFHFSTLPLSLGILQSYLRSRGYAVHSADLNTRLSGIAGSPSLKKLVNLFDKKLVLDHLLRGTPCGVEDLLDDLIDQTDAAQSDVVGISTGTNMSFFEIHMAFLIGCRVMRQTGKTPVFGGANLDYLWQFRDAFHELWSAVFKNFEYIFIGPGERPLADLIDGFNRIPGALPFRELPGAVYRRDGQMIRNAEASPTLVKPDFQGLAADRYTMCFDAGDPTSESAEKNLLHFYKWPMARGLAASEDNRRGLPAGARKETLIIPYVFNYNCPYHCAFCVQSRDDKPPVVFKDARFVIDDLEALGTEYGTEYFYFFNNAFNLSDEFVRGFCSLALKRGVRLNWSDCARFDRLDEKTIDLLHRAGCRKLIFGLDSASPKILKLIHKKLDLKQAGRVLRLCRERRIWAEVEVIVGLPHESEDDFQMTYDFVKQCADERCLSGINVNQYFVIPVSRFGRLPERYGIVIHRLPDGYGKMLERNAAILDALTDSENGGGKLLKLPHRINRLWHFSETNGRSAERIIEETESKFSRMIELAGRIAFDS